MMQHFIRVFTVCHGMHVEVTRRQRVSGVCFFKGGGGGRCETSVYFLVSSVLFLYEPYNIKACCYKRAARSGPRTLDVSVKN